MKTCIRCGWRGGKGDIVDYDEKYICDAECPACEQVDCIQGETELHLRLDGDWEHLVTVNKPARFARAVRRGDSDFITGAPTVRELARAISMTFEIPVKIVGSGPDEIVDEIQA